MNENNIHVSKDDVNIPVKEISELVEMASNKVPELITKLLKTIYSPEAGANMGKAVGSLYKELVDSGIPQDVALKMASDYMLSLKDIMKSANAFNEGHKNDR
jgi:hypothetical protein